MLIKELFVNNIERYIDPVIKVGDEENLEQELKEFVVTEKIAENFFKFFENYNETALKQSESVGVWVTGFFGSGKSHFAKVLGYLLENRQIGNRTAVEIFKDRLEGLDKAREIEGLLHEANTKIDSHVSMFQIEAEHDQLEEEKSIAKTLYQQFLKHQGLSDDFHIAELEKELIKQGKYEEFKLKIDEITGKSWEEVRESKLFSRKPISESLHSVFPDHFASKEEADNRFMDLEEEMSLEISNLTKDIKEYINSLERKGEQSPHIVFIIDEIGQYIGENHELLLELQTLVEEFGKIGQGRIWLIVTAQEKLEDIIEGVKRSKDTYKKIMDRFGTFLPLTAENIEKVLKERILKKKERAIPEISKTYFQYSGDISYASKMEGASRTMAECEEENFVASYPFLPYQLNVNQEIFANIRRQTGHSRKLTGTERSMLGVTQGILKSPDTGFKDSEVGRVVAYDEIFDQIAIEVPSETLRDIESATLAVDGDKNFAKRTLKTLYMLQQLKWVPSTSRNIAKGMVKNLDTDTVELEEKVDKALNKLVEAKYAIQENSQFEYITGSKKLIEEEISEEKVKNHEVKRLAKEYLRKIFDYTRVNYKGIRYFDVRIKGDGDPFNNRGEIKLNVYSPIFLEYGNVEKDQKVEESHKYPNSLYWIPSQEEKTSSDIKKYLRTKKVVERRDKNPQKSSEEVVLLREKRESLERMSQKIEKSFRKAFRYGTLIYDGSEEALTGEKKIKSVFEDEIGNVIPYIYTKFDKAERKVSENSIKAILQSKSTEINQIESELELFDKKGNINYSSGVVNEIWYKIKADQDKGNLLTGKELLEYFDAVPYGWDVILVRVVITALFRSGTIYLNYDGKDFIDYRNKEARELLIKSNKFKKTRLYYEEEEAISPKERQEARHQLDIIFNLKVEDTVNEIFEAINEQITQIKNIFEKQKIFWEQSAIKLKDIFYDTPKICSLVLEQQKPSKRLKSFLENKDNIQSAFNYQQKVQKFLEDDQSEKLSRIMDLPSNININSVSIDDALLKGYEENMREINTIFDNKEVIEKWASILDNYHEAEEKYKGIYEILHDNRFNVYSKMKIDIEEDSTFASEITGTTFKSIENFLCDDFNWDFQTMKCQACNSTLYELDNQILAVNKKRDLIISSLLPEETGKENKSAYVNLKAASKKTIVKNEDDLDEAVENIRRKVKGYLEKGRTVIFR